jgi:hypothetical protein
MQLSLPLPASGERAQPKGRTMLIKANGIRFNYEIEGPVDAPWLVFDD